MMTIIDIFIYVAFAFFASNLARKSENYIEDNDISPTKWDKYLIYLVIFFTIIGGIRWNVGKDCITYAAKFSYLPINFDSNEKLWAYFVYIFQQSGLHWTLGLALCAFIQIFFITKALKEYRWLIVFIPFVFLGGRYWMDCMNATRQMIVACGFLWASKYIYEKRILYYIGFVLVCSLIHQSAIILLPFTLFPSKIDITDKRFSLIIILLGCFVLGQISQFSGLANYVQTIAGATDYDLYGKFMSESLQSGYDKEVLKLGPMMLSYLLIPLFIIWFGPELRDTCRDKIPLFSLWFNFSFLYSCFYLLVCNLGHIFIRPFMYFSLFQMVMAALVLQYLWTEYKQFGLRQVATITFCFVVAINTCWDVYKASGLPFETSTYKISLFHKDQQQWFNLQ